ARRLRRRARLSRGGVTRPGERTLAATSTRSSGRPRGRGAGDELVGGHHVGGRNRKNHQRGAVHLRGRHPTLADIWVVEGRGGVGEEYDFIVAEQGVTRGGVAAVLSGNATDDHCIYT